MSDELTQPGLSMEGPVPAEQHYAPSDIAAFWRLRRRDDPADVPGRARSSSVSVPRKKRESAHIKPSESHTALWSAFTNAFRGNMSPLC
jgi:hypothetical protein